jgi:hypothetical protein
VRIDGGEERDPAVLALRAVEILRARLLEVPAPAPAPQQDGGAEGSAATMGEPPARPPAGPAPSIEAGPARVAGGLSVGPALLVSPGGVPAAVLVRLGAGWDPIPRVGIEATVFVPATAGTVSAPEGSVDLRVLWAGGGVRGLLTDPASDLSVAVGLGLQAVMLSFSGTTMPPWTADSGSRWAAAPYVSATVAYRLHPHVALRLDVLAAFVRPEAVVRIAGRDIASFGEPAVVPSLGVEVRP